MLSRSSELDRAAAAPGSHIDNRAHVRAELSWLHELIKCHVRAADLRGADAPFDEFAGAYISREEIDRYLTRLPAIEAGEPAHSEVVRVPAAMMDARQRLDQRIALAVAAGHDLRLERLARVFALDRTERAVLFCAVAVDLDAQLSRLYAYLQNDATRRRPTVALLARLCAAQEDLRAAFAPTAPLFGHRLLELAGDPAEVPLAAREVRPAAGIVDYLLGIDRLPAPFAGSAELIGPRPIGAPQEYYRHHRAIVDQLLRCRRGGGSLPACYVAGPKGAHSALIVESVAAALGKKVLRVRAALFATPGSSAGDLGQLVRREARVHDCVVHLDRVDDLLVERSEAKPAVNALEAMLAALAECELITTGVTSPAELNERLNDRLRGFELPYPTLRERAEIWRGALPTSAVGALAGQIDGLVAKFRFTPGRIEHVVRLALAAAPRDAQDRPELDANSLHAHCREEARQGLHAFCRRIVPRHGWDDIVLPADTRTQLAEVCRWVQHRVRVHDDWGFDAKLALGKGVAVLCSGPSGTGKTMSAEIIAADLDVDLYCIDLSRVVSKYIGETEKNLRQIFDGGATSNAILFFDEADSLFGKRTEVKDAHDRYANIEINYLLAEMDRYEGIIIVSTNLKGNLDQAFIRRFSHVVEYPLPSETLRKEIWRKSFPAQTPLGGDVDFGFLAQRFQLSGANIKNVALSSAFLAAAEDRAVGMDHLIRSTKREYQKLGRVCSKSDFGQYYALVREP